MNRTLFDCRIKRKVEARNGELFDITATLPKTFGLSSKLVKCHHCNESFADQKYLNSHVRFKHADKSSLQEKPSEEFPQPPIPTLNVNGSEVSHEEDEVFVLESNPIDTKKPENRHTVEFKVKTLDLLDNYTEIKIRNKWVKVAEKRGVSKCLVVKWNKNRDKIFAELQLNKKKNTGSVKAARQRRKLVGEKAKCSEKYPLAANRVVLEFKLRREKG